MIADRFPLGSRIRRTQCNRNRSLTAQPALALASGLAGLTAPKTLAAPLPVPHTIRAVTSSTDDVTLDFVGADINDVLKALAMQTHTNIVSGNDVKGPITVSLAHVSLEEALDLITKLSGYQYAKVGRTYVVGTPTAIGTLTASGTAQTPASTAVISFSYADPNDLTNEIKQLYPNVKASTGKAAGSQAGGGVLVVTGTPEDIEGVRRVVADVRGRNLAERRVLAHRSLQYQVCFPGRSPDRSEQTCPKHHCDACPDSASLFRRADDRRRRWRDQQHHVLRRGGSSHRRHDDLRHRQRPN